MKWEINLEVLLFKYVLHYYLNTSVDSVDFFDDVVF